MSFGLRRARLGCCGLRFWRRAHHRDAILVEMPFADRLDLRRSAKVGLARVGAHRIPDRSIAAVVGADLAESHRDPIDAAAATVLPTVESSLIPRRRFTSRATELSVWNCVLVEPLSEVLVARS